MAKANSSKAALIPAVAYIRMSGDKQEDSPEQQREEIRKLAERGGYRIVHEYFDPAISGDDTERRTAFLQMRDDAAAGGFRVILCWDMSRFGRFDILDAGHWIRPFRQAGVTLVTCAEGAVDWHDLTGQLLYSVQQMGKAQFLRDLSRNAVRGHLASATKGLKQGGAAPYGYQVVEQRLVVDPVTAPVVRRIYQMLLDRESSRAIADILNAEGIPSPGGKKWRQSRICKLVKRRLYLGEYRYAEEPEGKYFRASADGVQPGGNGAESNPLVIPNNHEALVSVADFEQVQRIIEERTSNKSPFRPKENPYRLQGLLRCGHCGKPMVGQKKNRPGGYADRSYICSSYQQMGTSVCRKHFIKEDTIAAVLVYKLREYFADMDSVEELRAEVRRRCQPRKPTCSGVDVARLQARIDKLSKQIDTGAEKLLAAPANLTEILTAKLQSWQQERDQLKAQLQAHKRPQEATTDDVDGMVDAIMGELQTLQECYNEADPGLLRSAFGRLVSKVELWFGWKPSTRGGTRQTAVPKRGLIHLRPDLQIVKLVSGDTSRTFSRPPTLRPSRVCRMAY